MLTFVLLAAFTLRLALALTHDGFLGVDGGAYLLSRNYVLGDEPTGVGFARPLLAPGWLLVPFTAVWGDDIGYKVWSAVSATVPLVAVYALARQWLNRSRSLIALSIVAFDLWQAEMFVTGALPLLGFGLILSVLVLMLTLHRQWQWRTAAGLAASLGLIAHVNHTSAGIAAIVVPTAFLALVAFERRAEWQAHIRVLIVLGIGSAIGMLALPWYWDVRPNSDIMHYSGRWIYLVNWGDMAWFQFPLAVFAGVMMLRSSITSLKVAGVVVLLLGTMLLFLSTDETVINLFYRSRYLVMMLIWPALVWVVAERAPLLSQYRPAAFASVGAVLIIFGYGFIWVFDRQTTYSDAVTPATALALEYLREEDPGTGVVVNTFGLAYWTAGLNKVPAVHPWTWEPPRAFTVQDQQVRCVLGWVADCDVASAVDELSVGYVLVDQRFPYYNRRAQGNYKAPPDQWTVTSSAAWLDLVYVSDSTWLWKIAPQNDRSMS